MIVLHGLIYTSEVFDFHNFICNASSSYRSSHTNSVFNDFQLVKSDKTKEKKTKKLPYDESHATTYVSWVGDFRTRATLVTHSWNI